MTSIEQLPDRALSIRQPLAWAILNAGKDIENRPIRWQYRGPICIHASLGGTRDEYFSAASDIYNADNKGHAAPIFDAVRRGGIIGIAEIVDVVTKGEGPWFCGPFGLVLKNVNAVPFIPVKGALGLFKWKNRIIHGETA